MKKIVLIIFLALILSVEKSHLRRDDFRQQQYEPIKIGEWVNENVFKHFSQSIFIPTSYDAKIFSCFSRYVDDDDGNSPPRMNICVKKSGNFSFITLITLSHAACVFLIVTGGLFDDIPEAEYIFKYAVRKTHDDRSFNSTMRRLEAGTRH